MSTQAATRSTFIAAAPRVGIHSRRPLWRLLAIGFIWATSLFVVALWIAGGAVQDLRAMDADTLNTLGRITGLVSANLLLYQVLLMARVPLFERAFGRDAITRMHRWVGFWSFWLLLAHIALLVVGYAAQAGVTVLAQLWDFVWNYPGMMLATAGTGLLVLVVVTSIRRARRAMRYESWHLLHLYGYLGVGLAIPHMLWTGADFAAHPLAEVYWWGLWATTAGAVIVFRVALPLWRSARHDIRVVAVEADGPVGVVVRMRGRGLERLGARAGQFFVWRFLGGPGWTRGTPLSLAADPRRGELVVAARMVGDGTRRLATLRRGTRVLIEGPYGEFTGEARTRRGIVMMGAGAGVAPLVSLLEAEPYAPGEAVLITRDHTAAESMRVREIERLVARRGLHHVALHGPRRRGGSTWLPATFADGRGAEMLRRMVPGIHDHDVYLCGPEPWMASVRRDLRAAGVPAAQIHSEAFGV